MNTIIKGLIVSLITIIVVLISIVNVFAIDIEELSIASKTCHYAYISNEAIKLKTGYKPEVEKVIADKLITLDNKVYIFDIDETVLNNYIGLSLYKTEGEAEYNRQWVCKDRLTLGLKHPELVVKAHIKRAIKQLIKDGKKVYFVTNTESHYKKEVDETISKLLDIENPQIIYKSRIHTIENEGKYKRFEKVAKIENISIDDIVFVGDDIKDFPDWEYDNFGIRYFLIPQRMYGIQFIYNEKYTKYIKYMLKNIKEKVYNK